MKLGAITFDTIAVCEGKEDCALVEQFIQEGLVRPMHAIAIGHFGDGPGIDGLQSELVGLAVITDFARVKKIAIVADNDLSDPTAFDRIHAAISNANSHPDVQGILSLPIAPYHRGVGSPIETAVILHPGYGLSGCFEDNLVDVLRRLHGPKVQCTDAFITCAKNSQPPSTWTATKEQKARVRGALTAIHTSKPNLPLHGLWKDYPATIPATSPEFDFLRLMLNAL